MFKCPRCKTEKPINEFCKRADRPSGVSICLQCERDRKRDYARMYREQNRDLIRARDKEYRDKYPDRTRKANLKRFYKMSPEQFNEMLVKQNNQCFICGFNHHENGVREQRLYVDHCHKTGDVRGLLCTHCNRGLGAFKDNVQFLLKSVDYLKNSQ